MWLRHFFFLKKKGKENASRSSPCAEIFNISEWVVCFACHTDWTVFVRLYELQRLYCLDWVLQYNSWHPPRARTDLNWGNHVGGDDNAKGAKMGEAPGEEHFLLRRTGDDGPAERSLLPDPVPHHRDLLPLLRLRVSHFLSEPQESKIRIFFFCSRRCSYVLCSQSQKLPTFLL